MHSHFGGRSRVYGFRRIGKSSNDKIVDRRPQRRVAKKLEWSEFSSVRNFSFSFFLGEHPPVDIQHSYRVKVWLFFSTEFFITNSDEHVEALQCVFVALSSLLDTQCRVTGIIFLQRHSKLLYQQWSNCFHRDDSFLPLY